MTNLRVGHGFDVHAFETGRPLFLGGVSIPHDRGLVGHSDADVLLHAICDALLGAAGLSDIGHLFSPTDAQFKNIRSTILLERTFESIRAVGAREIVNIDSIVLAEQPKISSYIQAMKNIIAPILHIDVSRIGIKATTCEGLGTIGRQEGIAASATCLLVKNA
ncbi:MAG: 2-C-methyl-D-erythritol 2,4-cyclodiphosphate synthase [candidate division Zixibacteria bacterium]|nr:2-C-methyl-D-erythritol 2,4-cyclodiphosphate synthase [candidate division Zixibacteria bacterium]